MMWRVDGGLMVRDVSLSLVQIPGPAGYMWVGKVKGIAAPPSLPPLRCP